MTGPGGFFELEDRSIGGESYRVYKGAPKTLIDILQSARRHGDAEMVVYQDRRLTFSQFFAEVDALAASLQSSVKPGDRVAIAMRNRTEWSIAFVAGILIGAIVVPVNSWGKASELAYVLDDSGASVVICDMQRLHLLDLADNTRKVIVATDSGDQVPEGVSTYADLIAQAPEMGYTAHAAQEDETCVIMYTSGSTGFPKGAAHRHVALAQSLFNMLYAGGLVMALEGPRELRGGATGETSLLTVPLFHATGLFSGLILPAFTGQKTVMMYKWDSLQALKLIEAEKITTFSTAPAILQDLFTHPAFNDYKTDTLFRVSGAGAAMPKGLPDLIEQRCEKPSRASGFGMTETVAVGSAMTGCLFDMKPTSSGLVSPIIDIRTADADGAVLAAGSAGEIELRGVIVMKGYWGKPEADAKAFRDGRWMKTGDVGYVDDDGFLYITGRIKEIVIRGSENIYPGEIENAAYSLSDIHECLVFGEPDQSMGEELVMCVYVAPGASLSEGQLRSHLSERLANYKVPRTIVFASQPFPRNASEKLHKLKVREMFLAGESL